MIDDERMRAMGIQARLFVTAGKLIPVDPEHVLGLIARVEFAEAQCQAIAEAAIARAKANGIDIDAEPRLAHVRWDRFVDGKPALPVAPSDTEPACVNCGVLVRNAHAGLDSEYWLHISPSGMSEYVTCNGMTTVASPGTAPTQLTDSEAADVLEQTLALPNFEERYGTSYGNFLRERIVALRGGSEKAHG